MVRGFDEYPRYLPSWRLTTIPIDNAQISQVRAISAGLNPIFADASSKRVRRGFNAFWQGLKEKMPEDRIYQFVRALDAVIASRGNVEFGERGTVFAGAPTAADLAECYRVRSKTEHLADIDEALPVPRPQERDAHLLRRVRQMEVLSRAVFTQIATSSTHRDLFRDDDAIEDFWEKPADERSRLWGPPLDIAAVQ